MAYNNIVANIEIKKNHLKINYLLVKTITHMKDITYSFIVNLSNSIY